MDFNYTTRNKLFKEYYAASQQKGLFGSKEDQLIVSDLNPENGYGEHKNLDIAVNQMSKSGLSPDIYMKTHRRRLVEFCVPPNLLDSYYAILRRLNCFPYSRGMNRRTVRTKGYNPVMWEAFWILRDYYSLRFFECTPAQYLRNEMPEEKLDIKNNMPYFINMSCLDYIIAGEIDKNQGDIKETIRDILLGENNTGLVTTALIRGILKGSDETLHKLLGDFLLAARLQEGVRQAVCENMDCGTQKAFETLFQVIYDNNLIRYSSVKRAVGTWIGIMDYENTDRIMKKVLQTMHQCIFVQGETERCLQSQDAIEIMVALWRKGSQEVLDAVAVMRSYLKNGSRQQKLVMSYYNRELSYPSFYRSLSIEVVSSHPEDVEMIAAFLPTYLDNASELVDDAIGCYRLGSESKRKQIPCESLFKERRMAEEHFEIMKGILERIGGKKKRYQPFLFPWYFVEISPSTIIKRLCVIAAALQEDEKLDYAAAVCSKIDASSGRSRYLELILQKPSTPLQRELLIQALSDKESLTRDTAFKLLKDDAFTEEEYKVLQAMLRFKNDGIRKNVLYFLLQRDNNGFSATVVDLLSDQKEEVRLAGLDLLLQIQKEEGRKPLLKPLSVRAANIQKPTEREQILIEEIVGQTAQTAEEGSGLYREDDLIQCPLLQANKKDYPLFRITASKLKKLFRLLDDFIDSHKNDSITAENGVDYLLGNCWQGLPAVTLNQEGKTEKEEAFLPLWKEFYHKNIKSYEILYAMYISVLPIPMLDSLEEGKQWERYYRELLGSAVWEMDISEYQYGPKVNKANVCLFCNILRALVHLYCDEQYDRKTAIKTGLYIGSRVSGDALWLKNKKLTRYINYGQENYTSFAEGYPLHVLCSSLHDDWKDRAEWEERFYLFLRVDIIYDVHNEKYGEKHNQWRNNKTWLNPLDYVRACSYGIISEGQMYRAFFEDDSLSSVLECIGVLNQEKQYTYQKDLLAKYGLLEAEAGFDREFCEKVKEVCDTITDKILDAECKRGDTPTRFSAAVSSVKAVYGIRRLVALLKAMGDDKLDRNNIYWSRIENKGYCLSRLLQVCRPGRGETAAELEAALKGSRIKERRLIEVGMYAPQWLDMLEEYLGYKGLKCGSYYFMAHMNERFDEKKEAIITKYTPLTTEELCAGAFDVEWFHEAYGLLGEERFQLLYDSAKYISEGSKHSRARKYADAALGRVTVKELEEEIDSKRNKDLLMSLGLIPVRDQQDMLNRYEYIQKFQKESRQFGAQRRASEAGACAMVLKNMATAAGYRDVTRLTLALEMELIQSIQSCFEWYALDEALQVKLSITKEGKPEIAYLKKGKKLAALPSAYKKNEYVLKLKETHKKLKEQYRRAVKMFEQAMEEREIYTLGELSGLWNHPVILPILKNLVFIGDFEQKGVCGLVTEAGFTGIAGKVLSEDGELALRVAHPYDLYVSGDWSNFQKLFFRFQKEEGRKQPFRQVFRELYVKLDEELQQLSSRMFAGNQIQPRKTITCLKSRRWVADYEEGLQKIYYKDNIIARIYALADWFSPSEIEAPTLEWVEFSDRKTFRSIPIKDVPEIVYSEVMRDVDLAVSVAHAGGVDPETSHSTVEMRLVIAACNSELFGLTNVRLEGSHAFIMGSRGEYNIHLGSGVIHKMGGHQIQVLPVHSQSRGRIFLPFLDEDPKTAEIMSKIILFAEDHKIKDPYILNQL